MKQCHSENLIVAQLVKNFPRFWYLKAHYCINWSGRTDIDQRKTHVPVKDDGRIAIPVWKIYPRNERGDK
jgi:hypothetical protein